MEHIDWIKCEDTILDLRLHSSVDLRAAIRKPDIFKWLMDAVTSGRILGRLHKQGMVTVAYMLENYGLSIDVDASEDELLTMRQVLAAPSEHAIDGSKVVLTPAQRFDLRLCKTNGERTALLRKALEAKNSPTAAADNSQSKDDSGSTVLPTGD